MFFTDSGSECADTAVKMVRAYWRLKGQATKTKMIGRARGYHGVNIAGTSLGGVNGNRKTVRSGDDGRRSLAAHLLASNAFSRGMPEQGGIALADELLQADRTARRLQHRRGVSSSQWPVPPVCWCRRRVTCKRLREICDQHNILLIFDEVITGFGRTGHHVRRRPPSALPRT